jgi:hypothetical protein
LAVRCTILHGGRSLPALRIVHLSLRINLSLRIRIPAHRRSLSARIILHRSVTTGQRISLIVV